MTLINAELTQVQEQEQEEEHQRIFENAGIHWPRTILEAYQRHHGIYTLENADILLEEEPLELYNGWLVWQTLTDFEERRIAGIIQEILSLAARTVGFGQAYPDQVECEMENGDVYKPDLCLVSKERAENSLKITGPNSRQVLMGGPELAVELRSPSNTRNEEREKRRRYFENRTLVVWDIDPERHKIWVWKTENPAQSQLFIEGEIITCPEILPGWQRAVSDLFKKNLSTEAIVGEVAQTWRAEAQAQGLAQGIEQGLTQGLEQGRAEGLEQGLTQGLEQGRNEGELEALRKVVLLQAQVRFGVELPADLETQLSQYDTNQLMALIISITTSATLADWRASFPA